MADKEATEASFVLPSPKGDVKEGKKSTGDAQVSSSFTLNSPSSAAEKKSQWEKKSQIGKKSEVATSVQGTEEKKPWARRTRGEKQSVGDDSSTKSSADDAEEKKAPWARKGLPVVATSDKPKTAATVEKVPPAVPEKPARAKQDSQSEPVVTEPVLTKSEVGITQQVQTKSEPLVTEPELTKSEPEVTQTVPTMSEADVKKEPVLTPTKVEAKLLLSSSPEDNSEVRSSPQKETPTDEKTKATIEAAAKEVGKDVTAKPSPAVTPEKPATIATTSAPSPKRSEPVHKVGDIQKKPEETKPKATQQSVETIKAREASKPKTSEVSSTGKAREIEKPAKKLDLSTAIPEADAGSEEKQFDVGQHFLLLAESGIDEKDNTKKALQYLISASKQGHVDASKLLRRCRETGRGITNENRDDVNWCINTAAAEKKVRHAARSMFGKLNQTHKSILSLDEYNSAVRGLTDNIMEQKLLLAAGKSLGDSISENDFIKSLSSTVQGKINLTAKELQDDQDDFSQAGPFKKMVTYPRQTFMALIDTVLEFAATKGSSWVVSLIPTNQIYIMAVLFAYSFVTASLLLFIVPLFMFFIFFIVLIFSTLQMFYKRKKLNDVSSMAEMLQKYDVGVNVSDTKSQYAWNSLAPYFVFFGTLPFAVISFALADKSFIPCSECCLICLAFTAFCFIGLSDEHDLITIVALTCNVLAALPTFFGNLPDIPVIKPVLQLLTGAIFSFDLGSGFQFNLGIPSLSYFIIPIFFIVMATKDSFKGSYKVLIPHLVCYLWFNLMTTMFSFSTWTGLLRATAGYALLPLLVPLSFFIAIGFIFYLIFRIFQTAMVGKVLLTVLLLAVPVVLTQTKALFGSAVDTRLGKAKNILMVIFGILSLFPLFFLRVPYLSTQDVVTLSWWDYAKTCGLVPEYRNSIGFQIQCAPLEGSRIEWNGTVQAVQLKKIDNSAENALKAFPQIIAEQVRCLGGEDYPTCDNTTMMASEYHFCTTLASVGKTCHLRSYDTYEFLVTVKTGHLSIGLNAGHGFREILTALNENDEVNYTGTLSGGLGTLNPQVKLSSIKCISRDLPIMAQIQAPVDIFQKVTTEGIQVAFKFFWYPLFEYVPDK